MRDKTRKPGLPPLPPVAVERVVALTLGEPPGETTHSTGRAMAAVSGVSLRSVQRIWARTVSSRTGYGASRLSTDPAFAAKLRDVVGLYLDPPTHSLVLSVDEKSQIQALDRTQPGLPIKKGRAGTMTHDYIRHGTTTLFAALNVLDGSVIGQCMARHRHRGVHPLPQSGRGRGAGRQADPRHPRQLRRPQAPQGPRLAHPASALDLPLHADLLLLAERRRDLLRHAHPPPPAAGALHSLVDLQAAINRYLTEHNQCPKPFIWTADPNRIIEKVNRGHQALASDH